ncbi:MAG: 23S rRNA (uracil(1939)-C(5))-methyltransferase RlmD [Gemmatimonadota bacterium]
MGEGLVLSIDSLDLEGRGVARHEGKVIFVEGALPGEEVEAERLRSKPRYETARTLSVRRESVMRVAPRCPHFGLHPGACGGCSMQHLEVRAQVALKQRALEDTLWHLGRVRPGHLLRPIVGPSWHYRQRARMTVRDVPAKGGVLVGFHERARSFVADMTTCPVLPARIAGLLLPLRGLVGSLSMRRRLPQIEIAICGPRAETIVLVLRILQPLSGDDLRRLQAFRREHDVSLWVQHGGPESATPLDPGDMRRLTLSLPEFGVTIPFLPTDFTQVNHQVNEVLVRRVIRLLDPASRSHVLDFFCGLGNFTLPLATRAARVVGIEGNPGLVGRARQAAHDNELSMVAEFESCNLFEWTSEDWRRMTLRLGGIDRVLIDPPREGAQAIARSLVVAQDRPERLVYVSCNPATLARDAAILVHEGGWKLESAGVVNMFPHTSHIESIAVFRGTA